MISAFAAAIIGVSTTDIWSWKFDSEERYFLTFGTVHKKFEKVNES